MTLLKTRLGEAVLNNEFADLKEILLAGYRIKETAIVDYFPDSFERFIYSSRRVCKATTSGSLSRYSVHLVIGNKNQILGIGSGKSRDRETAVKKALNSAKKNLAYVRLGHHENPNTIPQKRCYKLASSTVEIQPVSLKSGIIGGKFVKKVCELAGINDLRIKLKGAHNRLNYIQALFNALK